MQIELEKSSRQQKKKDISGIEFLKKTIEKKTKHITYISNKQSNVMYQF